MKIDSKKAIKAIGKAVGGLGAGAVVLFVISRLYGYNLIRL